jgi:hypothetical protein
MIIRISENISSVVIVMDRRIVTALFSSLLPRNAKGLADSELCVSQWKKYNERIAIQNIRIKTKPNYNSVSNRINTNSILIV